MHRDARRVRCRTIYQQLMDAGRIRNDLAIEDLLDSISNLLYGTIFTNYFVGRSVPLCQQYRAVAELIFAASLATPNVAKSRCHLLQAGGGAIP